MYFFRNKVVVVLCSLTVLKVFCKENSLLYVKTSKHDGSTCNAGDFAASFDNIENGRMCLSACAARKCARVFYHPDSESCLGCFSLHISGSLPVSVGSVHYEASFQCEGQFNTSCYKFTGSQMSWNSAKSYCQSIKGYLATMDSSAENSYVTNWLQDQWVTLTDNLVHIGVTDSGKEGTWLNVHGEEQTYKKWGLLQPDNGFLGSGNEDCVGIDMLLGKWHDLPCSQSHPAVCEIDMI